MDMVRATEDAEPVRSVPGMGDHPSATALYAAMVTALYRRKKTGKGGIAQSSLLQNGVWANACLIQSRLFGEHIPHRPPRTQAPNPLANHYRCRDGRWFLMALFNEQCQLRGFFSAVGSARLADDPRFATSATPAAHSDP
jgi:crotonobetainyl-CoA:carnitine CoA-transferase CaiB-like acyl-CoA transferase